MIGVAVLRHHAEAEVIARWHGQERRVSIPTWRCGALQLPCSDRPQLRPPEKGNADARPMQGGGCPARAQRGSFGSPSTISPMMFRWIWLEPA